MAQARKNRPRGRLTGDDLCDYSHQFAVCYFPYQAFFVGVYCRYKFLTIPVSLFIQNLILVYFDVPVLCSIYKTVFMPRCAQRFCSLASEACLPSV